MNAKRIASRIKVLETKAARLRARLAAGKGDACDVQQALDAVGYEHAELSAELAEVVS